MASSQPFRCREQIVSDLKSQASDGQEHRQPVEETIRREGPGPSGLADEACQQQGESCGRPMAQGKPTFITHPDVYPSSAPDCFVIGRRGYGRPYQHPLYTTTTATYGRHPAPPGLNSKFYPRPCQFTREYGKTSNYQDHRFTTELRKDDCVDYP